MSDDDKHRPSVEINAKVIAIVVAAVGGVLGVTNTATFNLSDKTEVVEPNQVPQLVNEYLEQREGMVTPEQQDEQEQEAIWKYQMEQTDAQLKDADASTNVKIQSATETATEQRQEIKDEISQIKTLIQQGAP